MRTSGLLAVGGAVHDLFGLDHEVVQLNGFDQVGVPDQSTVFNSDVFKLLVHCVHAFGT